MAKVDGVVRDQPDITIVRCEGCGLIYLESHDHIPDSYYSDSCMHGDDVPIISDTIKDCRVDDSRRFKYLESTISNRRILDFGSGAGGFAIMSSDVAKEIFVVEPESRYKGHYDVHKIPQYATVTELPNGITFDVITMFHVLEHIKKPVTCLAELKNKLSSGGEVIIEVPHANDALLSIYKSEPFSKFTFWGAHLYLFTPHTLELLAQKVGLRIKYIKQIQRYPLSNHIGWLVDGKPGGHKAYSFLDTTELRTSYEAVLASLGVCDTLICCMTV